MKNKIKRGFTIVELVIVIAVIGVLAAILIPTFATFINSAKVAADTQMVKNLNTALAADEVLNGNMKPLMMQLKLQIKQDILLKSSLQLHLAMKLFGTKQRTVLCLSITKVNINFLIKQQNHQKMNMICGKFISVKISQQSKHTQFI